MGSTLRQKVMELSEDIADLRAALREMRDVGPLPTPPWGQNERSSSSTKKSPPVVNAAEVKYATIFPAKNGFSIRVTYTNDTFKNYVSGADHEELAATMLAAIYGCEEPQ